MPVAELPSLERPAAAPAASQRPRRFRWTTKRYLAAARAGGFRGKRVELVNGEVLEMSPQFHPHAAGLIRSQEALMAAFGLEFIVRPQLPLDFGARSQPEPDLAVVPRATLEHPAHPATALLVVEIAFSTLGYDRGRKAALYARHGIADYWVLDVSRRRLEVCRMPADGVYTERRWLSEHEAIAPLACPEKALAVAALLPNAA